MIALHSVVLPMPLRPMIDVDPPAHLERDVLERCARPVVGVHALDGEQRRVSVIGADAPAPR